MKKIFYTINLVILLILSCIFTAPTFGMDISETSDTTDITIVATGDLMPMTKVQLTAEKMMNQSITDPYLRVASGYEQLFNSEIRDIISSADLAFGNLEGTIAANLTEKWYIDENDRAVCKQVLTQVFFMMVKHIKEKG